MCTVTFGPGSVVGIATGYGLYGPGIESRWGEIFRTYPDRPWGPPSLMFILLYYYFQLRTAAFKAYYAIWVRLSNFRHQVSPSVSPRESTQRRKVKLWARNVR
jgi:hypothetical protein